MTRLWLRVVFNLCAWLFAMTFAMAMDMATASAIALAMAISTAMAMAMALAASAIAMGSGVYCAAKSLVFMQSVGNLHGG